MKMSEVEKTWSKKDLQDTKEVLIESFLTKLTNPLELIWVRIVGGRFILSLLNGGDHILAKEIQPTLDFLVSESYTEWDATVTDKKAFLMLISDLSLAILKIMEGELQKDKEEHLDEPTEDRDLGV